MPDATRIPVIVSAARTPIGKFLGGLAPLSAPELGAHRHPRRASSAPASTADDVEEVIMGNVIQGGVGQAPARQALLKAGIPARCQRRHRQQGVRLRAQGGDARRAGDQGGRRAGHRRRRQESMSNAPYYVYGMRNGVKLGDQTMVDGMIKDGLWCASCDVHMGGHAEYTAKKAGVTRAAAGRVRGRSRTRRRSAAIEAGKFKDEIVARHDRRARRATTVVDTDEGPRNDTTAESLAKLRPAFPARGDDATSSPSRPATRRASTTAARRSSSRREEYARAHGLDDPGAHRRVRDGRRRAAGSVLRADHGGAAT